ncbi:hypothetical protein [Pontivivens nitratireducens]|uniref:Uncharacterized protein n=1 Tax=Pontivivens nitratireducens TaxID=2758038 RepID=A0A6G7VPN5_9RHOB|nr:hypothetical protein [Pontibrevibacter nitratireducens]QIK41747.1 hypothetical protein G8E03_13890 [Pontibrevibacter nitratireducens]
MTQSEIIHSIEVSPLRRWAGVIVTAGLGAALLSVAILSPPSSPLSLLLLIGLGGVALWQSRRLARAGHKSIHLTQDALIDEEGTVLTSLEEIVRIDRGLFALKPSNGFVLLLRDARPRHWVPGLWWQRGRRLGVGGTAHAQQTKNMADILQTMLVARDES